ncbi:hypothetical protein FGB62_7g09, partial [Gracilaria domingensis]
MRFHPLACFLHQFCYVRNVRQTTALTVRLHVTAPTGAVVEFCKDLCAEGGGGGA